MAVKMSENAKKMAVLEALKSSSEAISLPELLERLPSGFSERSVRRWVSQFVENGEVKKTGQKRGTRYQYLTLSYPDTKHSNSAVFSEAAQNAINYVRQPLFKRKPVTYNRAWLESYRPNHSSYLQLQQIKELAREGKRTPAQEPAGTYARKIYNRLLIDLSYNSSRLEGNTYSLIDTERLLLEGRGVEGKLNEEKVMILNHKEAIRHLIEGMPRIAVSYDEICTLHYLLSDGLIPAKYSGKVRDYGVRVGASTYIPLENPRTLNQILNEIAEKAAAIQAPHEQSFFLLIHVAYLQAFTDVNKRTARLSANIPLLLHNLVPLSFNAIEKDDYASAMIAIYELNDTKPLAELYRDSYIRSCHEYNATAEAIGFDEVRVRYREFRREIIRTAITKGLTGDDLQNFIAEKAALITAQKDRDAFLEDIQEDIRELAPQRIAGLGITRQQLSEWLAIQRKS